MARSPALLITSNGADFAESQRSYARRWRGDDDGLGGHLRQPAVPMRLRGIEVHAVALVQNVFFLVVEDGQTTFDYMNQFSALMKVLGYFACAAHWELGQICLDAFFLGGERQAFKEKGGFGRSCPFRELDSFLRTHDREQSPALLVPKKVLHANIENHGDTSQRGQGGDQLAVL